MESKLFKEHQLWGVIGGCKELATGLTEPMQSEIGSRVLAVASYLRRFQSAGEASLFSAAILDAMTAQWKQLETYLANTQQNAAYAPHCMTQLDSIVSTAASWPQPWRSGPVSEAMQSALTDFQQRIEEGDAQHEAQLAELRERLAEVQSTRDRLVEELARLEAETSSQEDRINAQSSSMSETFSAAQSQRSAEFDEWMTERRSQFSDLREDNVSELKAHAAKAEELLRNVAAIRDSVEEAAADTGSAILARDYASYAQQQSRAALAAFIVGVALFLVTGGVLLWSFGSVRPDEHTTWQWVALRLGLAVTLAGAAAFCLSLGNRFLRNATNSKRVELELRAIGPFLADLDEETRQASRAQLADRMFGHAWEADTEKAGKDDLPVRALPALGELVEKITPALKQGS